MATRKFPLGQIVATPSALDALTAAGEVPAFYLLRHVSGDWGTMCEEDKKTNEYALKHGERLMSSYKLLSGVCIWIITERDRSVTTILLPEDY